jgi:hypothetical protein
MARVILALVVLWLVFGSRWACADGLRISRAYTGIETFYYPEDVDTGQGHGTAALVS